MAVKNFRSVHITVRFDGDASSFDIRADERLTVPRSAAEYDQVGHGDHMLAVLLDMLAKVTAAYDRERSIPMETAGKRIMPPPL